MDGQYSIEDLAVIQAMETYGGSFVKALAVCFRKADENNYAKLKMVFPYYWQEYSQMAEKIFKKNVT